MGLQPGDRIGERYRIEQLLGEGGMGAVYSAIDEKTSTPVAIKIVKPEFAESEITQARFAREARVATRLHHARIARVSDAGQDATTPFLVMELLLGKTLGDVLRERDTLSVDETLSIAEGILEGLAYAHAQGIVHRDLKPDNVFLVDEKAAGDAVKLLDFGISKLIETPEGTRPIVLTKKDAVLGTPYYLAPEQARVVSDLDGRADIFSLGALLFECLAGRPPFVGKSYEVIIARICTQDVPPLDSLDLGVPNDVAEWISRALLRDRDARYASARAMLDASPAKHSASTVSTKAEDRPSAPPVRPSYVPASNGHPSLPVPNQPPRIALLATGSFVVGVLLVLAYILLSARR